MAAFDTVRTTYGSASTAGHISKFFNAITSAVIAWNDARATRSVLDQLSDRELEDIGLVRGDIETIATRQSRF